MPLAAYPGKMTRISRKGVCVCGGGGGGGGKGIRGISASRTEWRKSDIDLSRDKPSQLTSTE